MKTKTVALCAALFALPLHADNHHQDKLHLKIHRLQQQTIELQNELNQLQRQVAKQKTKKPRGMPNNGPRLKKHAKKDRHAEVHNSPVYVHTINGHPESVELNPVALLSEGHVITYISGTPVITVPYLGNRPSFDGSDYIVNIPSINRDIRLMQQRRKLYRAYQAMRYNGPETPVIAFSGKVEPLGSFGQSYSQDVSTDWDLGSAELDTAAALNSKVQAYISLAYNPSLGNYSNQRVANSSVGLGMGFINIGDLDSSPYYFTAGQIYVPFGRFSSAMISTPLTTILGRTKSRPFILGYQSQGESGPYAAIYGFKADTTYADTGIGGVNIGYTFKGDPVSGEVGASFMSSIDNSGGMQANGAGTNLFGGFSSITNGNEAVKAIPAIDAHGILRFDRYNLTAEWVGATERFRTQDLSYDGHGAKPQALQLEAGATFMAFNKPSSVGIGYQWSKETLALRLPEHRISGVYNISIWKDTVESLEYRHDIDFHQNQYANGAAPSNLVNTNTLGSGGSSDTVLVQVGVYF